MSGSSNDSVYETSGAIFDLTSDPGSVITLNGKAYLVSEWTTFNSDQNNFRQLSNQGIYDTYSSYYHEYTECYDFGVSVSVDDIGVAADYHKSLYDMQNMTETTDSYISTS